MTRIMLIPLAVLAIAGPVHGASESPAGGVEAALIERAERLCTEMLARFLRSSGGVSDPAVRESTAECYIAEARLVVLGHERALLAAEPALAELPSRKLSQDGGMVLDPYRPLASMRFAAPRTGAVEQRDGRLPDGSTPPVAGPHHPSASMRFAAPGAGAAE